MDYKINEGNNIGYMPTEFGTDGKLVETKIIAGAKLKKGQVVEITDDLTVEPTSGSSSKVLGVAMFDVDEGEPIAVETEGLFKLAASGSISAGDKVVAAADGAVATGTTDTIGIAIADSTSSNTVLVKFSI